MHGHPLPLTAAGDPWRGPALAALLHAATALAVLAWPGIAPTIDTMPVMEMVLAPAPEAAAPAPAAIVKPAPAAIAKPTPAASIKSPPAVSPKSAPVRSNSAAPPQPQETPMAADTGASPRDASVAASGDTAAPVAANSVPAQATGEADHGPAAIDAPRPPYPRAARQRGLQGVVMVRVTVSADGLPAEIVVKSSSGHSMLDDAAVEAVRRWRFSPARSGGRAVTAAVEIPVRFALEG